MVSIVGNTHKRTGNRWVDSRYLHYSACAEIFRQRREMCMEKSLVEGAFAEGRERSLVVETSSLSSAPSAGGGHIPIRPQGKRHRNGTRGSTAYRLSSNDCTPVVVTIAGGSLSMEE